MVEDRITDGTRIGQLLASELTGLERGPLGSVSVVDADTDAEPSPAGTPAYGVAVEGDRIGTVELTPESARLVLDGQFDGTVDRGDVSVEQTADGTVVTVRTGAAVKPVVDLLVEWL